MWQTLPDWWGATASFRRSASWIAIAVTFVVCFSLKHFLFDFVPAWASSMADVLLLGLTTSLFTRVFGGMGLFRDAIADVLGEDRWLDRRRDLDDLWCGITRRIALPGFKESADDSQLLLVALNKTMNKLIHKPDQQVNYYQKDMSRRIEIGWADQEGRIIQIVDYLEAKIIPFDPSVKCRHDIIFAPSTGVDLAQNSIELREVSLSTGFGKAETPKPVDDGNRRRYSFDLSGRREYDFKRTIVSSQPLDDDPIYVVCAGRGVVLHLDAIIHVADKGLRISFMELGLEGEFKPVGPDRPDRIERRTEAALLSEQGFIIVVGATTQNAAVSANVHA